MCSFGSCQTRFEFLSQFRKVRNAFECFVTQVQTRLPKTKCVWPMKINVICTVLSNNYAYKIHHTMLLVLVKEQHQSPSTVQITFIFIGQTHLVFGKRVCTCVTKHSNAFRPFLNWLKNSKRVWHVWHV